MDQDQILKPQTDAKSHGRLVASDFRPPWWLRNPHLQTLTPTALHGLGRMRSKLKPGKLRPATPLQRRRLELPDGDFIDLSVGPAGGSPVLIVHGLEGGLNSHYAGRLVDALAETGFQPIFMHLRGTSGEPNRLARSYHSGATEDLSAVVDALTRERPQAPIAAVGFSLGGNLLLKYLGERVQTPITRAVAISVPFVLRDAMLRMDLGLSRVYRRHLISRLKASFRHKFSQDASPPLEIDLARIHSFNQFDDQITAPLNGFDGVFDYYERASCRRYLRQIRTPTLIIHATDDPFMFPTTIPFEHELGPGIRLELTRRGGHVGFIAASRSRSRRPWLEQRIINALHAEKT
jgi:predicted alpha/beta-fold hydrolase